MKRPVLFFRVISGLLLVLINVPPIAHALSTTYLVDRLTDSNPAGGGQGAGLTGDLRYAITHAQSADHISFSVAGRINLSANLPTLNKNIDINGPGANQLTVDGAGGNVLSIVQGATVTISGVAITGGAGNGGGIFNNGTLTLNHVAIYGNTAGDPTNGGGTGAGIWNYISGTLTLNSSTVSGNSVLGSSFYNPSRGGGIANYGALTINNSTISGNSAQDGVGGGISNTLATSTLIVKNSTISGNSLSGVAGTGAGISNHGTVQGANTIIAGNSGGQSPDFHGTFTSLGHNLIGNTNGGSGFRTDLGDILNTSPMLGTLQYNGGPTKTMALLAGSPAINAGNDAMCLPTDQRGVQRPQGSHCDIGSYELAQSLITISGNAGVASATLSYWEGTSKTVAANTSGNYSITVSSSWSGTVRPYKTGYLFSPVSRSYNNLQSNQTNQNYAAQACASCADISVLIGRTPHGTYTLDTLQSTRDSYNDVDSGPVQVRSTNGVALISSQAINLKKNPTYSSYTELMGIPAGKLTDTYIFPWYNNATYGGLSSQLRFGNVGNTTTTVTIKIGGVIQPETFTLAPNQSARISFDNIDAGPVEVKSSSGVPIVASMRINLKKLPSYTSYTEFFGLSAGSSAGTKYVFPWYNNDAASGLNSQLRFGNVGNAATDVTVKIGGISYGPYPLHPNESQRVSLNVNNGPLEISSSGGVPIIASMRVNLRNDPTYLSYSEFMGLPNAALTTRYLFPWYNNATSGGLRSQLRFGNVGSATTTVTIKIGGVTQSPTYTLAPSESVRATFTDVDSGPVEIISSDGVPIIASMRINLKSNSLYSSYSEFMGLSVGFPLGLPGNELSTMYWFPWYNNATNGGLSSQLRFGVP